MLSSGYTMSNPKTVRDMEINIMQLYFAGQLEQAIILCDESLKT